MSERFYPTVYVPRLLRRNFVQGSMVKLQTDWNGAESELGTTLASTAWVGTENVGLSDQATADGVSSVVLSANDTGIAFVECVAMFNDGQIRKQQYEIAVGPRVA